MMVPTHEVRLRPGGMLPHLGAGRGIYDSLALRVESAGINHQGANARNMKIKASALFNNFLFLLVMAL